MDFLTGLLEVLLGGAVVCVSLVIIFLVYLHIKRNRTIGHLAKFPGLYEPIPFIDFLQIHRRIQRSIKETGLPYRVHFFLDSMEFLANHKEGVCVRYIAGHPEIFVYRADHVEKVLTHNSNITKGFVYDFIEPLIGNGLLNATGNKWRKHRKMLTPAFHFRILDRFAVIMNAHSKTFVERLLTKDCEEDLSPYISALTLDVVCETVMGTSMKCQTSPAGEKYLESIHGVSRLFMTRISNPFYWSNFVFNRSCDGREQTQLLGYIHKFTQDVIEERTAELKANPVVEEENEDGFTKSKKPFLDMMIMKHLRGEMSMIDMRNEVATFMFGGHDTTGVSLSFATFLIGLHPNVQAKLHEEVDSVFNRVECDVTAEHIKQMKYLDMVLKECVRLYPPASMISRNIEEPMLIDGKLVPKGTGVTVSIYQLHRDPDVFPDPEKFDPERFAPENTQGRHPFAFVPFSAGPRNCIGQKFALLEEKIVMCWLLRRFEWRSLDPREKLVVTTDLVLRPINKLRIRFSERQT